MAVATAGEHPGDSTLIARAVARFTAAHKLFFVAATLAELRDAPRVDATLLKHYVSEHARLSRELGLGNAGSNPAARGSDERDPAGSGTADLTVQAITP